LRRARVIADGTSNEIVDGARVQQEKSCVPQRRRREYDLDDQKYLLL
jgi:hypothetical protein